MPAQLEITAGIVDVKAPRVQTAAELGRFAEQLLPVVPADRASAGCDCSATSTYRDGSSYCCAATFGSRTNSLKLSGSRFSRTWCALAVHLS